MHPENAIPYLSDPDPGKPLVPPTTTSHDLPRHPPAQRGGAPPPCKTTEAEGRPPLFGFCGPRSRRKDGRNATQRNTILNCGGECGLRCYDMRVVYCRCIGWMSLRYFVCMLCGWMYVCGLCIAGLGSLEWMDCVAMGWRRVLRAAG